MKERDIYMSDNSTQDNFKLEVKDFGPIIEAKVNLRPLTVFVGPSNTGKSYLAILIYALHRHFFENDYFGRWRFQHDSRKAQKEKNRNFTPEIKNSIIKFVNQIFDATENEFINKDIVISGPILDIMRTEFQDFGSSLDNEICRCFGLDSTHSLNRKNSRKGAKILFEMRLSNGSASVRHKLALQRKIYKRERTEKTALQKARFKTDILEGNSVIIDNQGTRRRLGFLTHVTSDFMSSGVPEDENVQLFLEALADFIMPSLVGSLHQPAFYLPADRTGVMHAHSVVVSALIGRAPMAGLHRQTHMPILSGVLADFLKQLIELDRYPYRRSAPRHDFGSPIEQTILRGSVGVDYSESIHYPHFTYKPDGWKDSLSLMNASSMVSELAPVVLYLRHMVVPGNVLIVEEPESHLHPAMQVEFTRQLAALINNGFRVIVTTHSEWVLEELANIVCRSKLKVDKREKTDSSKFVLEPDQVGVWLFLPKSRPKGTVVKEIRLDDSGLYPSGFNEVAVALHNDWAELTSQIGEAE